MRYKPGHNAERRQALLQTSGRVVKQNGFAATGVDALTQAAGVTSGAFYTHFASKAELLKALIESESQASRQRWDGDPQLSDDEWIATTLARYLHPDHVHHPESGCVLPALTAEIARADQDTRQVFEDGLRQVTAALSQRLGSDERAWAFLSQVVGAVLIARALPNEASQRQVLQASQQFIRQALAAG